VPFGLAGIALGYWLPPRSATPIANLMIIPLVIVGFLWTRPPDDFPTGADLASQLTPTRSWAEVLDSVSTGDHPLPLHHVAALGAWSLAFFALAWWGYRRDEGEQFE
jgi:ABC-2 type transport system permease protein